MRTHTVRVDVTTKPSKGELFFCTLNIARECAWPFWCEDGELMRGGCSGMTYTTLGARAVHCVMSHRNGPLCGWEHLRAACALWLIFFVASYGSGFIGMARTGALSPRSRMAAGLRADGGIFRTLAEEAKKLTKALVESTESCEGHVVEALELFVPYVDSAEFRPSLEGFPTHVENETALDALLEVCATAKAWRSSSVRVRALLAAVHLLRLPVSRFGLSSSRLQQFLTVLEPDSVSASEGEEHTAEIWLEVLKVCSCQCSRERYKHIIFRIQVVRDSRCWKAAVETGSMPPLLLPTSLFLAWGRFEPFAETEKTIMLRRAAPWRRVQITRGVNMCWEGVGHASLGLSLPPFVDRTLLPRLVNLRCAPFRWRPLLGLGRFARFLFEFGSACAAFSDSQFEACCGCRHGTLSGRRQRWKLNFVLYCRSVQNVVDGKRHEQRLHFFDTRQNTLRGSYL